MKNEYYYNATIKTIIAAFGVIFKDVQFVTDAGQRFAVPLRYSPKEKALEYAQITTDYELDNSVSRFFPRLAFEMVNVYPDPIRANNPLIKMRDKLEKKDVYMFHRRPYNFDFNLYVGTKKFEDSLKIVEQILPFFSPDLIISIKDRPDYEYHTDIPVTLNSSSFVINWNDDVTSQRMIVWTLSFTVRAWLYLNDVFQNRIKETLVNLTLNDFETIYQSFTASVNPRSAGRNDAYEIVENSFSGPATDRIINATIGSSNKMSFELSSGEPEFKMNTSFISGETNDGGNLSD